MTWPSREFSQSKFDKAGADLVAYPSESDRYAEALEIVQNFRAAHRYPLNALQMLLRNRVVTYDQQATVAQRLKRVPSIQRKLQESTMRLTQMQDIGGCRAVLDTDKRLRRLVKKFDKGPTNHKLIRKHDYVVNPATTGYRSVHYVYSALSEQYPEHSGLFIEVQMRSKLQHLWATAVETVDTFSNSELKFGRGDPKWQRFFALMSSELARREGTSPVPGTPSDREQARRELKRLADRLNAVKRLNSYRAAVRVLREGTPVHGDLALLILTAESEDEYSLLIKGFPASQHENALRELNRLESKIQKDATTDAVIVGMNALNNLGRAYPNYYLDTAEFVGCVQEALKKSSD